MKRADLLIAISAILILTIPFSTCSPIKEYNSFVSTLPDSELSRYALETKVGITFPSDLRQRFLQDPEAYKQEAFEYTLSEISGCDPGLAGALLKIPGCATVDINTIEALEDVLLLASKRRNKDVIEKIYGKGIERDMWPVALERLVYKASQGEFDVDNPLTGSELEIYTRLAEFQEKYNTEMDQPGVEGPKPTVRGVGYFHETLQCFNKNESDIKFDYALMRWVLRCNSIRMWAEPSFNFQNIDFAQNEDLDVWLQFVLLGWSSYKDTTLETYKELLLNFIIGTQQYDPEVLSIGNEIDLHSKFFKIDDNSLRDSVNELIKLARKNYSGLVTYCDWDGHWNVTNIDWNNMDIVFPQLYKGKSGEPVSDEQYLETILDWKGKYPNKRLVNAEFGSLTITDGEKFGGIWDTPLEQTVNYDPEAQAESIDRQLYLNFMSRIDGVFIYCWDEPATGQDYDKNKLGYGIFDPVKGKPKPSFWIVYKYFR